jgi:CrcB protein
MLFAIAAGGALGSVARYLIGTIVTARAPGFPWATLAINVTGSLLFAVFAAALAGQALSPALRAGLTTGFCGGYTTFSTFSYETLTLVEQGSYTRAGAYAAASVALSLLAAVLGLALGRGLRGPG